MADFNTPLVVAAKERIALVIQVLRANNSGWTDTLQFLLDGMEDRYSTRENLFKIGELCHPKALGDDVIDGYSAFEWIDVVSCLHDDCARAFNELERMAP